MHDNWPKIHAAEVTEKQNMFWRRLAETLGAISRKFVCDKQPRSLTYFEFHPNPPMFGGVKTDRPLGVPRKLLQYMLPLSLKQGCSPKKEVGDALNKT